jgi:NADH:ubiquinone oxidoreductase subunit F (NADH-binding)
MLRNSLRAAGCAGLLFVLLLGAGLAVAQNTVTVRVRDACDPTSFNAAFGPGTCIPGRHGTTKLEFFVEELQQDKTPAHGGLILC